MALALHTTALPTSPIPRWTRSIWLTSSRRGLCQWCCPGAGGGQGRDVSEEGWMPSPCSPCSTNHPCKKNKWAQKAVRKLWEKSPLLAWVKLQNCSRSCSGLPWGQIVQQNLWQLFSPPIHSSVIHQADRHKDATGDHAGHRGFNRTLPVPVFPCHKHRKVF